MKKNVKHFGRTSISGEPRFRRTSFSGSTVQMWKLALRVYFKSCANKNKG